MTHQLSLSSSSKSWTGGAADDVANFHERLDADTSSMVWADQTRGEPPVPHTAANAASTVATAINALLLWSPSIHSHPPLWNSPNPQITLHHKTPSLSYSAIPQSGQTCGELGCAGVKLLNGTDFLNTDGQSNKAADSPEACCAICSKTQGCAAFSCAGAHNRSLPPAHRRANP